MTIRAVLIVNNHGKPRLTKFYSQLPSARQQALIRLIYRLVSKRPDGVCNFLDAPELTPLLPPPSDAVSFASASHAHPTQPNPSSTPKASSRDPAAAAAAATAANNSNQDDLRVIYRHYATLYFVFVVDQSESELGILDLIQVFVESLDRCFENVCELDLIFHFDEVHAILSEVIQGGLVVETNINEIVSAAQTTSRARKTSASSVSSGGGLASSLTPSSLNFNLGFPGSPGWGNSGSSSSPASSSGGGGGGIPWPKGTFVVDALSNLGNQYLGSGARGSRGRFGR
ncbi:Sigma-adaptin 3A [Thecaphora frezii]